MGESEQHLRLLTYHDETYLMASEKALISYIHGAAAASTGGQLRL